MKNIQKCWTKGSSGQGNARSNRGCSGAGAGRCRTEDSPPLCYSLKELYLENTIMFFNAFLMQEMQDFKFFFSLCSISNQTEHDKLVLPDLLPCYDLLVFLLH